MGPTVLEKLTTPEELRDLIEREFDGGVRASLRPSYEKGVEAVLWIEVLGPNKYEVQHRAAILCADFHDRTRKFIIPITVDDDDG